MNIKTLWLVLWREAEMRILFPDHTAIANAKREIDAAFRAFGRRMADYVHYEHLRGLKTWGG